MDGAGELGRAPVAARGRMRVELWGVFDQSLVSGVNFLTIILLARALAPADFGYFVLAFTLLQTAGTLQAALVTRPHNVLAAVLRDRQYVDYSTTTVAAQVVFTSGLTLLVAACAVLAYWRGLPEASLVLALAAALVGWQFQELGRRMLYTEGRLAASFANDLLSYGSQAVALVVLSQLDLLTGARALLTLAITFAFGAAVLAWQLRASLAGRLDASALSAGWQFGKWLGLADVGQWLSTHFYVYLGAAIVGTVTSAALKASQTLLGPISVFLAFVTSYLPIVFARELRSSGTIAGKVRRSLLAITPVVVPYCVLVGVFAEPLLELVYGPEYGDYADVVQLFALYYIVLALSSVAVAVLSARRMTHDVFVGQAAGAALSLAFGWLLLRELGAAGGVVGMLMSLLLAMSLFLRALRGADERVAGRELVGSADDTFERA